MIDWKSLSDAEVRPALEPVTPTTAAGSREFINSFLGDGLFYLKQRAEFVGKVARRLNETYRRLQRTGRFEHAKVSVLGANIGSVILYDILAGADERTFSEPVDIKLEFE